MIDTHAHLDALDDDPAAVVGRARDAGVTRIIAIGTRIESCRAALAVAETEDGVYAVLGIHPHEAGGAEAERIGELRELLSAPKAVGVGETGLDYYRDYAPRERQQRLFEAQLELAVELDKPVIVHTRAADGPTVDALRTFNGTVVMHCFSSPGLLDPALEHGWYVSFAGNVTYPNAYDLRAVARAVPGERLLVETDSPYLSPQPRRGRPNEPANVVHTVAALADARGEDPDGLAAQIDANADAAFRLA